MKKKSIIGILCIVILSITLASCGKYKSNINLTGDEKNKISKYNSGFIVEHGDYIYFINGQVKNTDIKSPENNEFGKVKKGAIYRSLKKDLGKYELVVPTVVYSNSVTAGFSIIGNWIYYTTPSTDVKKGTNEVQNSYLNYMRTSLSGKETQLIDTVKGPDVQYKFTSNGLIYYKDSNIFIKKYNDKKVSKKVENKKLNIDYVNLYQNECTSNKSLENRYLYISKTESNVKGNNIFIGSLNQEEPIILTKGTGFLYSIIKIKDIDSKTYMLYSKSKNDGYKTILEGLYLVEIDNNGNINIDNSKKVSTKLYSDIYLNSSNEIVYMFNNHLYKSSNIEGKIIETKLVNSKFVNGIKIIKIENDRIFYLEKEHLYMLNIKSGSTESRVQIAKEKVLTSWLMPEIIDGQIYFINDEDKNLYRHSIEVINSEELSNSILCGEKIENKKENK